MSQKPDESDETLEEKEQDKSPPVEEGVEELEEEEAEEQPSVEAEATAEKAEEKEEAEAEEEEAEGEEEEIEIVEERFYTIPFGRVWTAPRGKRTPQASRILRDFVRRHMKAEDVKISNEVNQELWARSIKKPPRQIKVRVVKDKEGKIIVYPATAA